MSTLFVNNLNTASGSTITVPTGKQLIVTDQGGVKVPGSVIQVVYTSSTTATNLSGNGFTEIGLNGSITPTATSSKILVSFTQHFRIHSTNGDAGCGWGIKRDIGGTEVRVYNNTTSINDYFYANGSWFDMRTATTSTHLDSPSTTSAITYKAEARRYAGTVTIGQASNQGFMTLMEIAQ